MTWVRVEVLLTAVVGLGALSIDMFLPSLPAIATVFAAPPATVQLTVTLFLMAFAASQLVYGPLSDRFGRRWVLIAGLALYAAAGLGCALASSIGEDRGTIEDLYEPYLIQIRFLERTPRGRVGSRTAYSHLGYPTGGAHEGKLF